MHLVFYKAYHIRVFVSIFNQGSSQLTFHDANKFQCMSINATQAHHSEAIVAVLILAISFFTIF